MLLRRKQIKMPRKKIAPLEYTAKSTQEGYENYKKVLMKYTQWKEEKKSEQWEKISEEMEHISSGGIQEEMWRFIIGQQSKLKAI